MTNMKKVIILQHRLLHYRINLFELLHQRCLARGIELHLVHGQASRRELEKKDTGNLAWADVVKNRFWEVGVRDWVWQPFPKKFQNSDLIVVMQESRLLSNYRFLLGRLWSHRKIAYWGHGVNFQSDAPNGLRERWKKLLLTKIDWWFAYTQISVDMIAKSGFPIINITCLNNAIDTDRFKQDLMAISETDLSKKRTNMGISSGAPVGIFCGSLYSDKRLDFLIDSIDKIRLESPEFHCIILGDGPSMPFMREAAISRPWLHLFGVTKGTEKALYFRLADYMLNPGLVGLHIVDAFCAGLVIVTTSNAKHSPEIAYLVNGVNGIMTEDNPNSYAQKILYLTKNKSYFNQLKAAALADADVYTLNNMADNFIDGISRCLAQK
jgi:glycosyltransferase involved in cell wall biosynthesis